MLFACFGTIILLVTVISLPLAVTSFSIVSLSPLRTISRTEFAGTNEIRTTSSLSMISNFLGGNKGGNESSLPKDVKEAVSKCRDAVQKGLENKLSRMSIEFPVGTKFGIEGKGGGRNKKGRKKTPLALANDEAPTKESFDTSDRELARLFVDMFQPVGGDAISVIFGDENLAQLAEKNWKGELSASCKILTINRGKKRGMGGASGKKKKRAVGFAAKMAEEFDDSASGPFQLPKGCEVALFVAPGSKELISIKRICNEVGMGTLIILINARLDLMTNVDPFYEEFESVFYLSMAPQENAPGCLMHRSYPNEWSLARKPKVGPPQTFARFSDLPSGEECAAAYDSVEVSDLEKGVESALENVANWFN